MLPSRLSLRSGTLGAVLAHRPAPTPTRLLALALAAGLALPSTAAARTIRAHNITSPSGLIGCLQLKFGGPGIECQASYLPDIGPLDSYLELHPRGRAVLGERGDFPGYSTRPVKLRYGDVWRVARIRCSMRRTGLTCRNRDRHGFHMAKGDVRRF
jgi:hypothetical protein